MCIRDSFCVKQCCAIVKGIGEIIEPFAMPANFDILLVKPQAGVPTGKAFGMLDFNACAHPDCEAVKKALQDNDLVLVQAMSGNSLEYSAFQLVPEIQDIKKDLLKRGLEVVLMSGSGSTVFALSQNKEKLSQAANDMRKQGHFVTLTNILS